MDPTYLHFWAKQNAYILGVIFPVSIGFGVILIGLAAIFVYTFRQQHYRLWHLGKEEDCSDRIPERLKTFLSVVFGHARFWREGYPGTMHFLIFWGTVLVFLGKGIRIFSLLTGLTVPPQGTYLFASFIAEIGGMIILLGGVMAVVRRFVVKPPRLDSKPDDHLKYLWVFLIILTGYLIKSYRLVLAGGGLPTDSYSWAPISSILTHFMLILPSDALNELFFWHRVLIHVIPAVAFFGYIVVSRSSLEHIYLSAINVFFEVCQYLCESGRFAH